MTRSLLAAIADDLDGHPHADEGWQLLGTLDRDHPDATQRVLAHPYVRAWAVACLGGASDERGYLSALAAAAAVHAGVKHVLQVQIRDGRLHLPTVGTVHLASSASGVGRLSTVEGGFTLLADGVQVTVAIADGATAGWQPTVRLAAAGIDVTIEDGDPYRDCHRYEPHGRLSSADEAHWRTTLTAAARLAQAEMADYLPGLRHGLRMVTPLQPDPAGAMRASTARDAFGAVAAGIAAPEALAVMLVHEFQHGKLGALLDLCDLLDPQDRQSLRVGWRPDPRPIEGVLQGTYAHLAVADVWRRRAAGWRPAAQPAAAHFARYRDWTAEAIETLMNSGALTAPGEQFVNAMAKTLTDW
jgi:uncharacterized protein